MASRVKGTRSLKRKLEGLKDDVPAAAREAARDEAGDLAENIRADAPVDTGHLRDSVEADGTTVTIGADYADMVRTGTDPHTIEPDTAEALSWPGADHPVARVDHPGTEPNDFIESNLRRSRENYPERVADEVNRRLR